MIRLPENLAALVEYGVIQEVVRPLMSGKEAQIYLVVSEGEERVAKVYKEAQARTFKHRAEYTEGRKTRNSRDQRAINKRTRHGRARDEAAWRSTEVEMIHRLRDAGVRVPEPHQFIDGVLVMELVVDANGNPAPRLGDLTFEPKQARDVYDALVSQVVRMLCAGVVHGDLSEFNVLMGVNGPTLIDFPQAVDPASNQNSRRLLLRDVENLHRFLARFAPQVKRPPYGEEMWQLYQANRLTPTTKLDGTYRAPREKTDTAAVLTLIGEAGDEERARREARGEDVESLAPKPLRTVVDLTREGSKTRTPRRASSGGSRGRPDAKKPSTREADKKSSAKKSPRRQRAETGRPRRAAGSEASVALPDAAGSAGEVADGAKPRRRRRRRPKRPQAPQGGTSAAPRSAAPAKPRPNDRQASSRDATGQAHSRREGPAESTAGPAKKRARRRRRPAARRPREPAAVIEPPHGR